MISLKLDVTKIDKARLFPGKKGTYLNLILIETPNSQYSDYMVKQQVSKEEREQGIEIILGDGKNFASNPPHSTHAEYEKGGPMDNDTDDLPF